MNAQLSKRAFLKSIAVAGLATTSLNHSAGVAALPTPIPRRWDQEADVIIVGAGGGGLVAACTVADRGLTVTVLEKEPLVGGSSLICGGGMAFAGTHVQQREGIEDNTQLFTKDLLTVGEHRNDPRLIEAYMNHQIDVYQWLVSLGLTIHSVTAASGMSVRRMHNADPAELIRILRDHAVLKGARILLQSPVSRLVYDDRTHKIVGIFCKCRGRESWFRAKRGVILACGGYARNPQMLGQYTPLMANAKVISGVGNVGDGIRMAQSYGADLIDTPYVKATYGFTRNPASIAKDYARAYYQGAIIVNKEGQRIINESKSYKLLGDAVLAQTDAIGFQVYDEPIRQATLKNSESLAHVEKQGAIISGRSLHEVAEKAGVAVSALEKTVRDYNGFVAKGNDPFGRTTLAGGFGKPVAIKTPPYYIFPSTAVILGTYCGVRITPRAAVLDVFDEEIPGLYAVGELTGGFHGAAYMSGTALGKALVFGRIAGLVLAER